MIRLAKWRNPKARDRPPNVNKPTVLFPRGMVRPEEEVDPHDRLSQWRKEIHSTDQSLRAGSGTAELRGARNGGPERPYVCRYIETDIHS